MLQVEHKESLLRIQADQLFSCNRVAEMLNFELLHLHEYTITAPASDRMKGLN